MNEQKQSLTTDLLSYGIFLKNIQDFKSAGTRNGNDFNKFDIPNHLFFKVVFYFWNGDIDRPDNMVQSGGLLAPTWLSYKQDNQYYDYNSAWAYLKLNNENERAEKLVRFVDLLSNISTNSPWYFQSIEGLDTVRTRPVDELKFDERKKITIKCMQDSYDDRIGTLLDLYRDITWSWIHKREVIPANLRKFDMGIYIFSSPITNIHNPDKKILADSVDIFSNYNNSNTASVNPISSKYITSYKYLEFHNCEIDYNSPASGLGVLDNIEGISPVYNIDIYYDDCYETRYNEFMMRTIGDMIAYDMAFTVINDATPKIYSDSTEQSDSITAENELNRRVNLYNKNGILENAINEIVGAGLDRANEWLTQKFLGNLHGFSLEQGLSNINNLMQGKILTTAGTVQKYINNAKADDKPEFKEGKLFNNEPQANIKPEGDIFPDVPKQKYIKLGNIFKAKTMISNI